MGEDNYHRKPKNKWNKPHTNDRRDNKRRKTDNPSQGDRRDNR